MTSLSLLCVLHFFTLLQDVSVLAKCSGIGHHLTIFFFSDKFITGPVILVYKLLLASSPSLEPNKQRRLFDQLPSEL